MKRTLLLLFVISSISLFSQSLSVFDVDPSGFPTIKAKFYAFDANWQQITGFNTTDFEIKENGISRNVLSVSCPAPKPPVALSSVLVMDVSGSMGGKNIELAKEGARAWIRGLPLGKSECAITSFDTKNYFVQDFTTDKNKLLKAANILFAGEGTDYNVTLIERMAGEIFKTDTGWIVTIVLKSDSSTFASGLGSGIPSAALLSRLDSANISGLVFVPVLVGTYGTWTSPPPDSPQNTQVINIPPGDWQNGYFKVTFSLPSTFFNISLSGAANIDDLGRVFLNGNPLSPSIFSSDPNRLMQNSNSSFTTTNSAFFHPGDNELIFSNANPGDGPTGAAFYAKITFFSGQPILLNFTALSDLVCESSSQSELMISNPGWNDLVISKMELKGTNLADFSFIATMPLRIKPDSSKKIIITFAPKSLGQKTADLEIISNANPDSVLIIPLFARKDSVALIPNPTTIDIGYLCSNETKDTSLTITNKGTIASRGIAVLSANLKSSNIEFQIPPGIIYNLPLTFAGIATEGTFTETVTIYDTICGYSSEVYVTGEVALPVIDANDLTIAALVGSFKDDRIVVKNNSKRDFTIANAPAISGPFQIIGNPFPIFVPVGDSAELPIRYNPDDNINDSLTLILRAEPCDLNKILQLYGVVIKNNPKILADFEAFPDLICYNTGLNNIDIRNTGGNPLVISNLVIKGLNSNEFSINETTPITIVPDSSRKITVTFKPSSTGQKSADLDIISNADPDSLLTIPLIARKDSVSLIPETSIIDLGYMCPNETKDTIISIRNEGTIASGGYALLSANLQSSVSEFFINIGDNFNLPVSFAGIANEGAFTETISIYDSICGYSRQVQVIGEVALPFINADDITITALTGSYGDEKIIIMNNSKRDITIANAPFISGPFQFIGNPFPMNVIAGSSAELPIRYTPDDNVNDSLTLIISAEPCNISNSVDIVGIPATAMAILQTPDLEAYPGEIIDVPVILKNEQNLAMSGVKEFEVNLNFNTTLLTPLNYPVQSTGTNTGFITLADLPADIVAGASLTSVKFKAGLGDSTECKLLLTDAKAVGGTVDVAVESGTFRLLGICPEGGNRLINPSGNAQILSIKPNPSSEFVEIVVELIESGYTKLYLTDILGREKICLMNEENRHFGIKNIKVDISLIGAGVYYVILKTATVNQSFMLMINN